jgi:RNA polymerase primary sigma factor
MWTASAMDTYLAEIGRYPLLSAGEEAELAIRYERGRAAERQLAENSSLDHPRRQQLEQAVDRGHQARRRLIECNLRLVVSLMKRFQRSGLPFGDLIQEGNIGLMEAVERYDHRRGVRFATYAGWWIQQTARRAARSQARVIRLPLWVSDELHRLRQASEALESLLGRPPTVHELAEKTETSVHRIRQLTKWGQEILSLDMPVGEARDDALGDLIPDRETAPVEGIIDRRALREEVQDAVGMHLEPRDRELLRMRYGLDGGHDRTLEEVAHVYGITRERIRQLEKRALQRLRRTGGLHRLGER